MHPGTRGSPARHSRTGKELFADNLEANSEVKIGGICCAITTGTGKFARSEEHTSELQSHHDLVCRLLLEKKNSRDERPRQQVNPELAQQLGRAGHGARN